MKQDTITEPAPAQDASTVWVVAANLDGDPHPHVLAVYDNEGAARKHEREIKRGPIWSTDGGALIDAFWTYDVEVLSAFGGADA